MTTINPAVTSQLQAPAFKSGMKKFMKTLNNKDFVPELKVVDDVYKKSKPSIEETKKAFIEDCCFNAIHSKNVQELNDAFAKAKSMAAVKNYNK